jgi:ribosomal peptide maturation radical SAM protein 1
MRVQLVNMPWAAIDTPSLALGILQRSVNRRIPTAEVEVVHANLDYVDWITGVREFKFEDYQFYSLGSYFLGCGDWVFSSALYEDPSWRVEEFEAYMQGRAHEDRIKLSRALHELAPAFIEDLARRIVDRGPDVVGFTTTFQQNTAALAAARHIKRLAPEVATVFGGANCDGDQGVALHRNFGFVDFVVRGEGEVAFPQFLEAHAGQRGYAEVPGLCWREDDGGTRANALAAAPLPPAEIVAPDFGDYFGRVTASAAQQWTEPKLVVESSRGCWWGEKHHCTFCGLNGSFMQFRGKSPNQFVDELLSLVERHKVLDVFAVDNIIDMEYTTTALPMLKQSGYDLRLHYEIKSNMRRDQLRALAEAGVSHVQPGIENLSTRVLKLMRKGVTGCQNVRMLRDAESLGLVVSWNYLCGFPEEAPADYHPIVEQFPALHHLGPPGSAGRIEIERFSPYHSRPELGFPILSPAEHYSVTYDLPESELLDLAYLFAAEPQGISETEVLRLREATSEWEALYPHSRLTHCDLGDRIVLTNTRRGFDWRVHCVEEPFERAVFELLDQPHSIRALAAKTSTQDTDVAELMDRWLNLGLVFTENGQFVQVAPAATNQELLRIDLDDLRPREVRR